MTYDELQEMMRQDSQIDPADLLGESVRVPVLVNKWLGILDQEKRSLKVLEFEYHRLYRERYDYYQGRGTDESYEADPLSFRVQKSEISIYLSSDQILQKVEIRLWNQKTKVDRMDAFVKHLISARSFCIKQAIDMLKFNNGIGG